MYTCYIQSFNILAVSVAEQAGLNLTWSKIPKDTFLHDVAQLMLHKYVKLHKIWAATWQNQQNDWAPSEDSDQPGHPPSLISLRCPHEETLGP